MLNHRSRHSVSLDLAFMTNTRLPSFFVMHISRNVGAILLLLAICFSIHEVHGRLYIYDNFQQVMKNGQSSWKAIVIQSNREPGKHYETYTLATYAGVGNVEDLFIVNKIGALQPGVFQHLSHLRNLHLGENSLPVIRTGDFSELQLSNLYLGENNISRVEAGSFANSVIDRIDLSHNRLQEIPVRVFDSAALTKLILANNEISRLTERSLGINLTHLDLSHNRIRDVPLTMFENLYALKYLNMSYNNLPTLTSAFWLRSLEVLDASHNVIRLLINGAFEDYPRLRQLHLDHNELLYLNPQSFLKPAPIEVLHIEHNLLTFLPGELGEIFANLKYLKYGGNPWSCSCLIPVEGFIKSAKVVVDKCDKVFFTDGKEAVCLTAYSDCYGNETLLLLGHPEIYQSLIDGYKC